MEQQLTHWRCHSCARDIREGGVRHVGMARVWDEWNEVDGRWELGASEVGEAEGYEWRCRTCEAQLTEEQQVALERALWGEAAR